MGTTQDNRDSNIGSMVTPAVKRNFGASHIRSSGKLSKISKIWKNKENKASIVSNGLSSSGRMSFAPGDKGSMAPSKSHYSTSGENLGLCCKDCDRKFFMLDTFTTFKE